MAERCHRRLFSERQRQGHAHNAQWMTAPLEENRSRTAKLQLWLKKGWAKALRQVKIA
jgi:hypothetical protein